MKQAVNYFSLFVVLAILGEPFCDATGKKESTYKMFNVTSDTEHLYCGTLTCPLGSTCVIEQANDVNDKTKLVTLEQCFDSSNKLIQNDTSNSDANPNDGDIYRYYNISGNGVIIDDPQISLEWNNEYWKNFEKSMKEFRKNIHDIFNKPFFRSPFLNFNDNNNDNTDEEDTDYSDYSDYE